MKRPDPSLSFKFIRPIIDLVVTLLAWCYFTFGFVMFFSPFYLMGYLFSKNVEYFFQRWNHIFFNGLFFLIRLFIPGQPWHISRKVRDIRSSVIVCNHLSYIDPLLLISLFTQHKTIVKNRFFGIPVFSWILRVSGYLPSTAGGNQSELWIEGIRSMECYLKSGGNLFIFPEGTRNRNNHIGRMNKGAFKIAKLCNAPVNVIFIRNTDTLFPPGKLFLNTGTTRTITVEQLTHIEPDYQSKTFVMADLISQVRALLEKEQEKPGI